MCSSMSTGVAAVDLAYATMKSDRKFIEQVKKKYPQICGDSSIKGSKVSFTTQTSTMSKSKNTAKGFMNVMQKAGKGALFAAGKLLSLAITHPIIAGVGSIAAIYYTGPIALLGVVGASLCGAKKLYDGIRNKDGDTDKKYENIGAGIALTALALMFSRRGLVMAKTAGIKNIAKASHNKFKSLFQCYKYAPTTLKQLFNRWKITIGIGKGVKDGICDVESILTWPFRFATNMFCRCADGIGKVLTYKF